MQLTHDGATGLAVVSTMSKLGHETGGGLHVLENDGVRRIDEIASAGLVVSGDRLVRLLIDDDGQDGGELLVYEPTGVRRYLRVDGVVDAHDVLIEDEVVVIASTARNRIMWVDAAGRVERELVFPGDRDAWHVNCMLRDDREGGRLLAAAFGREVAHRGWSEHLDEPVGFVFDAESGETIVAGLTCPHQMRRQGANLLVCDSGAGDLAVAEPSGEIVRRIPLGGWVRGLLVTDDVVLVGITPFREPGTVSDGARIAVLDARTLDVTGMIIVPDEAIYDIVLAPPELVSGLERGFRTNPMRERDSTQRELFRAVGVEPLRLWAIGERLPPDACRVAIEADLPQRLRTGETVTVAAVVTNWGGAILVSIPPYPVQMGARWELDGTDEVFDGHHIPLPEALPPGLAVTLDLKLTAPSEPGRHRLVVTLVQELVAWFDHLDSDNALVVEVEVVAA